MYEAIKNYKQLKREVSFIHSDSNYFLIHGNQYLAINLAGWLRAEFGLISFYSGKLSKKPMNNISLNKHDINTLKTIISELKKPDSMGMGARNYDQN